MKPATAELLQSLEEAEWFAHVGEEAEIPRLAQVSSWDEAIESCAAGEWDHLRLQARNFLSVRISGASRERWRPWPAVQEEIHARVWEMIQRKAADVPVPESKRDAFYGSITWDLHRAAMEVEHADIAEPGIAGVLAEVYKLGHFPCGCEEGTDRLVIF